MTETITINTAFRQRLEKLNACSEALRWLEGRTPQEALKDCERGDWLLWWFFREKDTLGFPDIRIITKSKADCARLVQHLMKDERSIAALDACDRYYEGEITEQKLADAYAAADAAAYADAYAAADAAAYAARVNTLKKSADICRQYFFIPEDYLI
jgi:hypothetical protein